jgi:PAS domain S-box-containing protein
MKSTDSTASCEIDWQDALHIFNTVPDLYLIISPDLQVLTASNTYLKAISTSREELKNMSVETALSRYGLADPAILDALVASLDAVLRTAEPQFMDVQRFSCLKRSAVQIADFGYWQVSNTPVLDENENLLYIIHKVNDITDIIRKEKEFQASLDEDLKKIAAGSDFLRKAEEAGSTGSYRLDLKNQSIWFSDGMYKLIGYEPQAFVPTLEFLDSISLAEDVSKVNSAIENSIATKKPYAYVRRIFSAQGEIRCILSKGRVIEDENGNPLHILGVSHDITEKTRQDEDLAKALQALSKSRDLLQSIFDTTLIGMSLLQPIRDEHGKIVDFTIVLVSKGLERETGRTDLVGKVYTQEYPGVKTTGLYDLMIKAMETGVAQNAEYYYPYDGFDKWFSCTFVKMDEGIVASNLDITPIRSAESKIRKMEEVQKLEIFKATIRTQEEERNRIAEDLRNGIGQLLYAVKMNLRHLDASAAGANPVYFLETKKRTDEILAEAIKEVRRLSHLMTPAILEDFGLEETIKDLCRQFSPKLHLKSSFVGLTNRFDRYLEVSVYRMAQDLLQNIIAHTEASRVSLELKNEHSYLLLKVIANEPGFLSGPVKGNEFGFETLMNRVELLNGKIDIHGVSNTEINIRIPVSLPA